MNKAQMALQEVYNRVRKELEEHVECEADARKRGDREESEYCYAKTMAFIQVLDIIESVGE